MPLFEVVELFVDETAREGPEQMAVDEALLDGAEHPILRVYRWPRESVSFGYSQSLSKVRERYPLFPLVRRWTAGGIVEHGRDLTFALIVPSREPLAKEHIKQTYRLIHLRIMSVLRELGYSARLAGSSETVNGPECFSAPALYDVIDHRLRKLCGGAQRRTRQGILHQGSIQNVDLPPDFAIRLLGLAAAVTRKFSLSEASLAAAKRLGAGKYGSKAWLERIA